MKKIRAVITGVGGYVPDYILSNKELESMVDTNDEWIVSRTGIRERRILKGDNLGVSYMGVKAVMEMLEKTNTNPKDIDLIIFSTVTPDMVFPATANILANEIGATNSFGFDISAACSGFIYGLTAAAHYIESGACKRVLLVGADKMSSIVDYQDRSTCILFGDGAGCVMLSSTTEEEGILDFVHKSDGKGAQFLHMKAGGSKRPASHETVDARMHYIYQAGNAVFKHAVTNMTNSTIKVLKRNNLSANDLAWVAPHQANKRVIDATIKQLDIPNEKVMMNIERYGNTTAATIPLLLWDYETKLKKGDKIVLVAFGGGFTWGSVLLKWAYDSKNPYHHLIK